MRRRRRTATRKQYSLSQLLERQPKTLKKHEHYPLLLSYLYGSSALQDLRVGKRCFSVLNAGAVHPDNLQHFYLTYRLPKVPFFPLYFQIKRDYERERRNKQEARRQYILQRMRDLPEGTLAFIKYLGHLEAHYHSRDRYPLWQRHIFPATKKRADEYSNYSALDWVVVFRRHLKRLGERYPAVNDRFAECLIACYLLELLPPGVPPAWPASSEVSSRYRRLCLRYHPDHGGDARLFVQLKAARDTLIRRKNL